MTRLQKHMLIDVCLAWPLLISCLLAASFPIAQAIAYIAVAVVVLSFVVAASYPLNMWEAAKEMAEERTGPHLVYVLSSSAVEIGIFLYTGFWGLAYIWAVLLAFEIAAQIVISREGK